MEHILYGFYQSRLGEMVLAYRQNRLCWLGFMVRGYKGDGLERMMEHFNNHEFIQDNDQIKNWGDKVMRAWEQGREKDIALDLSGTLFQKSVWNALLDIPRGKRCSYGDVANDIGQTKAVRAVGSAVGENPISLIIPCHRVVRSSGALGNYGWGVELKQKILAMETENL